MSELREIANLALGKRPNRRLVEAVAFINNTVIAVRLKASLLYQAGRLAQQRPV